MAGDPLPESLYTKDVYPGTNSTYSLGSEEYRYAEVWCQTLHSDAETIYIGDTALTEDLLIALLAGAPEGSSTPHSIASHIDTSATGAELDELTGGGDTSLHSHTAGGLVMKSGTITTNALGNASVTFNTSFPDANYAILLTPASIDIDAVMAIYGTKTTVGFIVKTQDDGGKSEANIDVDWLAIEYNNP